jgi:hypothetical protein
MDQKCAKINNRPPFLKAALNDIIKAGKSAFMNPRRIVFAFSILFFASQNVRASDSGYLQIHNYVGSYPHTFTEIIRWDGYSPAATDGFDSHDIVAGPLQSGSANIYSDINDGGTIYYLWFDARAEDSTAPYYIKLGFEGILSSPQSNYLSFQFPYEEYEFGNVPILYRSDRLPYGPVVDVRKAIAQNLGRLNLIDVSAGTYNQWNPYCSGELTIGTRLLADLDDSNQVDFNDYAKLVKDWNKPQGQYLGDITGPNGIPDGYVNYYDLSAFCDDWLAQ